jgi:glycerophosphoryl diester phosphodiesterase
MPFDGFSQQDYAQKLIDEYKAAGVPASDVWAQSFNLEDVLYWIENEPEFGAQAVYLIDITTSKTMGPDGPGHLAFNTMEELKAMGVNYIAPPTCGCWSPWAMMAPWCRPSGPRKPKRPVSTSSPGPSSAPAR